MSTETPLLVLASASPRRCELLRQAGIAFRQQVADVEEIPRPGESPVDFATRVALDKARAVCRHGDGAELPVLGADTVVVVDGRILGKPADEQEAAAMLGLLSGRCHAVISAVAMVDGRREAVRVNTSRVWFRTLSEDEFRAYLATGESMGKAGAYAIQGRAAVFIERLDGSYSGVMGLPLFETAALLHEFDIEIPGARS